MVVFCGRWSDFHILHLGDYENGVCIELSGPGGSRGSPRASVCLFLHPGIVFHGLKILAPGWARTRRRQLACGVGWHFCGCCSADAVAGWAAALWVRSDSLAGAEIVRSAPHGGELGREQGQRGGVVGDGEAIVLYVFAGRAEVG